MALRVVAKRLITSFHRPTLVVGPLQRYALSTSSVRYLDVKDLEKAKGALSALKEDPGNDVKLKLYGFYKQVLWPIAALWRSSIPIPRLLSVLAIQRSPVPSTS